MGKSGPKLDNLIATVHCLLVSVQRYSNAGFRRNPRQQQQQCEQALSEEQSVVVEELKVVLEITLAADLEACETRPPYALHGRAGTGKSFVCGALVRHCQSLGVPTLYCTWPARAAFKFKQENAWTDADTIYSAFNFDGEMTKAADRIIRYGVIFIDEYATLSEISTNIYGRYGSSPNSLQC